MAPYNMGYGVIFAKALPAQGLQHHRRAPHREVRFDGSVTEHNMHERPEACGASTGTTKGFKSYMWDAACEDTIITALTILMVCAVVTGIWTKEALEGTSIGLVGVLLMVLRAVSYFKERMNFPNLNTAERASIHVKVVRAGQRQTISISDLVVGNKVCGSAFLVRKVDWKLFTRQLLIGLTSVSIWIRKVGLFLATSPVLALAGIRVIRYSASIKFNTVQFFSADAVAMVVVAISSLVHRLAAACSPPVLALQIGGASAESTICSAKTGTLATTKITKITAATRVNCAVRDQKTGAESLPSSNLQQSFPHAVCLNVQKFVELPLMVNSVAVAVNFLVSRSGGVPFISGNHLEWIYLVMGTIIALALIDNYDASACDGHTHRSSYVAKELSFIIRLFGIIFKSGGVFLRGSLSVYAKLCMLVILFDIIPMVDAAKKEQCTTAMTLTGHWTMVNRGHVIESIAIVVLFGCSWMCRGWMRVRRAPVALSTDEIALIPPVQNAIQGPVIDQNLVPMLVIQNPLPVPETLDEILAFLPSKNTRDSEKCIHQW